MKHGGATVNTSIYTMQILLAGLFLALISTSQAEQGNNIELNYHNAQKPSSMMPAGIVLAHNQWLLESTTIGVVLKESSNPRVIDLYTEAAILYRAAKDAHQSGRERDASVLANKSISAIYTADKVHHNIKGP